MEPGSHRALHRRINQLRTDRRGARDPRTVLQLLALRAAEVRTLGHAPLDPALLTSASDDQLLAAVEAVTQRRRPLLAELFALDPAIPSSTSARSAAIRTIWTAPAELFTAPDLLGRALQAWHDDDRRRLYRRVLGEASAKIRGREAIDATRLYTPAPLAQIMADWTLLEAAPEPSAVLDPACGAGDLLLPALELLLQRCPADRTPEVSRRLVGFDLDRLAVDAAAVTLRLREVELTGAPPRRGPRLFALDTRLNDPTGAARSFLSRHRLEPSQRQVTVEVIADLGQLDLLGALVRPALTQLPEALRAALIEHLELWSWSQPRSFSLNDLLGSLDQRYDALLANPPFLSNRQMGDRLRRFVRERYRETSADIYGCFLARIEALTAPGGRSALLCPEGWTTLRSFAGFRARWLSRNRLERYLSLGQGTFSEADLIFTGLALTVHAPPEVSTVVEAARMDPRTWKLDEVQRVEQRLFSALPGSPMTLLPRPLLEALAAPARRLGEVAQVVSGIDTGENARFVRFCWEIPAAARGRFVRYSKGKGFRRWAGADPTLLDWAFDGALVRGHPGSTIRNPKYHFRRGLEYSYVFGGKASCRRLEPAILDHGSVGVFAQKPADAALSAALLNSTLGTVFARALSPSLNLSIGVAEQLPLPTLDRPSSDRLEALVEGCVTLKRHILSLQQPADLALASGELELEAVLQRDELEAVLQRDELEARALAATAALLVLEAEVEAIVVDGFELDAATVATEVAPPVAAAPLVAGLETLPGPPPAARRPLIAAFDLARRALEAHARAPAESRPTVEDAVEALARAGEGSSRRPRRTHHLPPESALEAGARELGLHPVSLLELAMTGDRQGWSKAQVEAGASALVLDAAQSGHRHGVITAEALAEALATRRAGEQAIEALLAALEAETAASVDRWLDRHFFRRLVKVFHKRPPLWHIRSRAARGTQPALSCFLLAAEVSAASLALIAEEIDGQEDLARTVEGVQRRGFYLDGIEASLAKEPLDRFCSTAGEPPRDFRQFLEQEASYRPDPTAGARVNLAPLERAGLLSAPVLGRVEVVTAIADRARWRAAERRRCRQGTLPAPTWWLL